MPKAKKPPKHTPEGLLSSFLKSYLFLLKTINKENLFSTSNNKIKGLWPMYSTTNLLDKIYFVNLGPYKSDNENYFEWTTKYNPKSTFFEIKLTRNAPEKNIFYCVKKADIELVYFVRNEVVFTIGADPEVQSLLLETIMEHLMEEFFKIYDESLLMTCYGDRCDIFNGFSRVIRDTLKNLNQLDLYKTALVHCKGCNKTIKIIIKRSLVENATKPTVPIVYAHSGHAVLVYVDKQYKVRGNELVTISY